MVCKFPKRSLARSPVLRLAQPSGVIILNRSDYAVGKLGVGDRDAKALAFFEDMADGFFNFGFFPPKLPHSDSISRENAEFKLLIIFFLHSFQVYRSRRVDWNHTS